MKIEFNSGMIPAEVLAPMCDGTLRTACPFAYTLSGICTDSGEADANTVFVALHGERSDGHDFIPAALAAGCRCFLCEHSTEEIEAAKAAAIVVPDTELALAKLANGFRNHTDAGIIAITGSVGKTTTKDLMHSVLKTAFRAYKTPGNHNSLVGMPLSMMEIPRDSEYAVVEMGMSGFSEIERLSIAAEPDIAIITNIGTSHMEMLGSKKNICRAKLEILSGLRDGGTLILNGDEPLLANVSGKNYRTVYVSVLRRDADYFAKNIRVETDATYFDVVYRGGEVKDLCLRLMGKHNVYAALYAFAVATLLGMKEEDIRSGMLNFVPEGMRQQRYSLGNITVFEDCYNASPESVLAALDVLTEYRKRAGGRSVAVLGDMLELGEGGPSLHRQIGEHLARLGVDELFTIGALGNQIAIGALQSGMEVAKIHRNSDRENLKKTGDALISSLRDGDAVLFKASRAVGAERIIAYVREQMKV